jgi:hypothetical protein
MGKTYIIKAPLGNIAVPKEVMTDLEVRQYAEQLASNEVWKEKAQTDSIDQVLEWLGKLGYEIAG